MTINKFFKLVVSLGVLSASVQCLDESSPVWGYECIENKCKKIPFVNEYSSQSLIACRMICGEDIGTLWPKPTGSVKTGEFLVPIDHSQIKFQIKPKFIDESFWEPVKERFLSQVNAKIPDFGLSNKVRGKPLMIKIFLNETKLEMPKLTYDTNESYSLNISQDKKNIYADINALTFFGARHGLETLTQLIVYDDVVDCIQILIDTNIHDAPAYKHRGILLDTAHHYFSLKSIKRVLDGMALSKMNTFHWHMINSNSFPLVVVSHPDLHRLGAYSLQKIYTPENIAEIVRYALVRGIRVIPEFEGPAHIGEGWQKENLTVCFGAQPWTQFCNQPPCGQFDPTIDSLYDVLEDIYSEMFNSFDPNIFHMGGNGPSPLCWNSTKSIRDWMQAKGWGLEFSDFVKLWGHFQTVALERLDRVSKGTKMPIVLWASQLTAPPFIDEFLNKSRYIIQTTTHTPEELTREVLQRGFRLITTNNDIVTNEGASNRNDGWQKTYENRPDTMFNSSNALILGSEVAVWSEHIDEFSLDSILWPKASALAERLWSNPNDMWHKAEDRLLLHRELLAQNGLFPDAIQPEWCVQNQNKCPRKAS